MRIRHRMGKNINPQGLNSSARCLLLVYKTDSERINEGLKVFEGAQNKVDSKNYKHEKNNESTVFHDVFI